ncbi:hypothetical protein BLX87_20690 [Bacillus sp. VT-16-64]|nr:hypothetical protein BLX87_20690 [Bacillus sp. VT-16-64]
MESNLYELTTKKDEKAVEKVINLFAPKIKKTLLQTDTQNREDLEQELHLKLIHIVKRYDPEDTVGFWEFYEMFRQKIS